MSVSIKDLAKHCGLSVSTVSRALNNQYGVSQKAVALVQKAVKDLGYVQDLNAKELVSRKSNLVGMIIPESDFEATPPFFEILPYISKTLALFQKEIIITPVTAIPKEYVSNTLHSIIKKRKLEGCIILPGFNSMHPLFKEARKCDYPIVTVGENILSQNCSNINMDNQAGAYLAVQDLITNGHTRIGFINGPSHASICQERLAGYKSAMQESGLSWDDGWIMESDFTGDGGAASIEVLMNAFPSLTACFLANDLMAIGAMAKLSSMGIEVPNDLSIIGYDGIYLSKYTTPPLSTITINSTRFGIKIAESLLQIINGGKGRAVRISPYLISRESVKKII